MLKLVLADEARERQAQPLGEKPRPASRHRAIKITLRQLTVFEAVARCGSVAKAAEEIALSQSAVSMALRDLEDRLQAQLFVRQGRKLLLSQHGRQVQARTVTILRQAQELESFSVGGPMTGSLRLGATPSLAYSDLAQACARFTALHPGVTIDLSTASSEEIVGRVRRMSLDLGFIACPTNRTDLETRPWLSDPLAVFCAPHHPLAGKAGAKLETLLAEKWALEKMLSSERWSLTMESLKYASSLQIAFESDSIEAVKMAVRTGGLLGCLSQRTIADDVRQGALVDLRVPEFAVPRRSTVIWKTSNYQGQVQQAFLDFLDSERLPAGQPR